MARKRSIEHLVEDRIRTLLSANFDGLSEAGRFDAVKLGLGWLKNRKDAEEPGSGFAALLAMDDDDGPEDPR